MADEDDVKNPSDEEQIDLSGGPQIQFNTDTPGAADKNTQPQAGLLAQYIKDISFENPNAPQIYQTLQQTQPDIKININVAGRQVAEDAFEVELKLEAKATAGEQAVYVVELLYAGLFQLRNLPQEAMQPFLLVEAPRLIFPFARRILSDAVRDGGYPPLTLEPIDFAALYQQRMAAAQQNGGPSAPVV